MIGIGGNSDTDPGGNGSAVVTGAGSALNASGANGFVGVGRGGTGSLEVTDQAAINAIIVSVGRAAGGFGTLTVDNASLNLSGQQTAGTLGANLSIGVLGGIGTATIATAASSRSRTRLGGAAPTSAATCSTAAARACSPSTTRRST